MSLYLNGLKDCVLNYLDFLKLCLASSDTSVIFATYTMEYRHSFILLEHRIVAFVGIGISLLQ